MTPAYIGLGSNLQEPLGQLRSAIIAIQEIPGSHLASISRVYRSKAVGPGDQPDYLNAAVRLDTELAPEALLQELQRIETRQGRIRTQHWGARTLDLDILLYGEQQIATATLTIPHPALKLRNFVMYPLADISGPNLELPDGSDLATLIARCPRGDLVATTLQLNPSIPG